jgi:hypothetical protein
MISGLVFSKDRAMQLDGMLRSFFRWCAEPDLANLTVLYATSGSRFHDQYRELEREHQGRVHFVEETDFRTQVLGFIGTTAKARRTSSFGSWFSRRSRAPEGKDIAQVGPPSHILFLVDDTLFVRRFSLRVAAQALDNNHDALGFSFRLGTNTVNSYVFRRSQNLPSFEHLPDGVKKYRWPHGDGDFAYPLELSSSFYCRETIVPLVLGLEFSHPNSLESQLSVNAGRLRRRFPFLLCWDSSVAFSAPVNRVQEVFENRSGGEAELSVGSLADMFDSGKRLNFEAFEGFIPNACHQEVSLSFKPHARQADAQSTP